MNQVKLDKYKLDIRFKNNYNITSLGDIIYYAIRLKSETIYDNKYKRTQCQDGKLRSREDIYRLCKYYLTNKPSLDFIDNVLTTMCKDRRLASSYCCVVCKRVHWFNNLNKCSITDINNYLDQNQLNIKN